MKTVKPHEFFRIEFDKILEEGKRQERIHHANKGEAEVVRKTHEYFSNQVLPRIVQDDYVFEAARRLATEYSTIYFFYLRLTGLEASETNTSLHAINNQVIDTLERAHNAGFASLAGTVNLTKASDFTSLLDTNHVESNHPLYPILGEGRDFYKLARNVGSHQIGNNITIEWKPRKNIIVLRDNNNKLSLHVYEFQQRFRYLVYFCELGIRGILSAFCQREQGEISNRLVREYNSTFPSDWEGGEEVL